MKMTDAIDAVCRSASLLCVAVLVLPIGIASAANDNENVFRQKPEIAKSIVHGADAKPEPAKPTEPAKKSDVSGGPAAQWIWGGKGQKYYFRKEFAGGSKSAALIASCDNVMTVFINGKRVGSSSEWANPLRVDVQKFLQPEKNVVLVEAANQGGVAGLALKLVLAPAKGDKQYIVTDKSWQAATKKDAEKWDAVATHGKMGVKPWGNVFSSTPQTLTAGGLRDVFNVLPGFQVELLFNVPKAELGSWVSITFDNKGRLIASDQGGKGLCRITPPKIGSDEETKVERLAAKITSSQGMLYAFDSLYVSVNGGPGSGLYRLQDTNGDDQYDKVTKLKALQGGGEHGPHAVRLAPDGKSLYVIAGNHTNPPENFDASRLPSNWSEDLLLPRQWDARGHARGKLAPGGWIAKTDPEGKTWEIISSGYRNPYDMDFNADGELFAYDADMEWDFGSPWYRPTRVVHAVSGSEFGWRSGTGKWATYYVDSLPPAIDIGPGSPVGATFGYGTKFPAKYQKALYILDWTFGTMYAIHTTPQGASYAAVKEEFVSRTPLPLTDAAVGPDGALYFTIGGRGAQSALFRVVYKGAESTAPVDAKNKEGAELRALRQQMEAFHGKQDPQAVETVWPQLKHADRHIRYAARVALEAQDPKSWQDRVLAEKDPQTLIIAAVALARQGDKAVEPKLLDALDRIEFAKLSETQQLDLLRAFALVFVRMGQPDQATTAAIAGKLDKFFPAKSDNLNRELSRVLVYLNSPTVITKTLKLMAAPATQSPKVTAELLARNAGYGGTIAKMLANQPEIQNIHYAFVLRNLRYGWTLDQRREYFKWFEKALQRSGGASYQGFINNIRKEAVANLSPAEQKALAATTIAPPPKPTELPKPIGPGRKWTMADLLELTNSGIGKRNFENGRRAYAASRCIVCHRFDGEGGATGPDLSNVAGRFSYRDLSEALIDPSKVVSDQYRASVVVTVAGKVITGRIASEQDGKVTIITDPEDATKVVVLAKGDIDEVTPSKVSLMPKDLMNVLNKDEVLDLLAYLMSRGNPNDRLFAKTE